MVDPTCLLCKSAEETTQHFLLECPELAAARNPIIDSLLEACSGGCNPAYDNVTLLKLVIDCSTLLDINTQSNELSNVEFQARRLCFALDCERYKKLSLIPHRNRNLKSRNLSYSFRYTQTVEIPQVRTSRYGTRSFRSTAAKMWNNLPQHFRDITSYNVFKNQVNSWSGEACVCSFCSDV